MKNDDLAISEDLENLVGSQIQKILATQQTEPLQQLVKDLIDVLHIDPVKLATAFLYLDQATVTACINANAETLGKTNILPVATEEDDLICNSLLQPVNTVVNPSAFKPEKLKMVRYRLEVGRKHQVSIEDIKNVLISESGVERTKIGYMDIRNHYTLIDLPNGMPADIFQHLQSVEIKQHTLQIKRVNSSRKRQWQRPKGQPSKQQKQEPEEHTKMIKS